jgi:hypothetical protein
MTPEEKVAYWRRNPLPFSEEYFRELTERMEARSMTPPANTCTVTYERPADGATVTMQIDASRGPDNLLGLALREAAKNEGGTIPPQMTFHGEAAAQSLFDQFMAAYTGGKLVAPGVAMEVPDIDDDLGVYRNTETGKLEVWVYKQTVYGGEFPDTEEGMVAASRQAEAIRQGKR